MNGARVIVLWLWIATCAASAWIGWDYRDGKVAKEKADAVKAQAELTDAAARRASKLAQQLSSARSALAEKDKAIAQEVSRYEQVTPADQRSTLPGTWRMRHDAAATGVPSIPGAGSLALGAAAPVDDAAAIATVARNYAVAHECAAKLEGWVRRYRELER